MQLEITCDLNTVVYLLRKFIIIIIY